MIRLDRVDRWGVHPMLAQTQQPGAVGPGGAAAPSPAPTAPGALGPGGAAAPTPPPTPYTPDLTYESTPANNPFHLPKWAAVGLGAVMIGAGLYSTLTDVEVPPLMAPPGFDSMPGRTVSKGAIDKIAGVGSVAGGAYILMEALGIKF